ncbi:respiratory nitrate reductase subunit gamma [Escherichia coli]|uniref:respiratory nitrate reductase subunit gamma n=1 Tax=Escherichia coli TaxID=562 RepID=UPI0034D54E44
MLVIIALSFLLLRRILIGQVRYVSYVSDYFPLFLIFSVVISGILVRYFFRVDIMEVKRFTLGLFLFRPYVPQSFGLAFYLHFFLVCFLFASFIISLNSFSQSS